MSTNIVPEPFSFDKLISNLLNNIDKMLNTRNWVNGRPVLLNGDVWCPLCERWHANNNFCQQSE